MSAYIVKVKCGFCKETISYTRWKQKPNPQDIIQRYRGGRCKICGSIFGDPDVIVEIKEVRCLEIVLYRKNE